MKNKKMLKTLTLILENGEAITIPDKLINMLYIKDIISNMYKTSTNGSISSDLCTDSFLIKLNMDLTGCTSSYPLPDDTITMSEYLNDRLFKNPLNNGRPMCDILAMTLIYQNEPTVDITVDWLGVESEYLHERQQAIIQNDERIILQNSNSIPNVWPI